MADGWLYWIFIQCSLAMNDAEILSFADRYRVPLPAVRRLVSTVAEQCALVANRFEPEGHFTFEQLSAVETLGAEIGAAIMEQFPEPEVEPPRTEQSKRALGIGGPSNL